MVDFAVLLGGDVGVVIGARAEVVAFHEAKLVGHDPASQKQSDYTTMMVITLNILWFLFIT